MDNLQRLRILLVEIDASDPRVVNLSPELTEVGASFMPHPCFREETTAFPCLEDTYGEVDILTKAHLGETA